MPFAKSVSLSRSISLLTCNIPAKWIRLICLVVFFAVVLFSLPVHLKYDGANAQSSGRLQSQGPPSHNLPNLDEARRIEPGTPKIMPPVPATKCRGRDEKCKKARRKISNNLPANQDRLLAYTGYRSRRDYAGWLKIAVPALSVLDDLIYGSVRMISDIPGMSYSSYGDVLTESAAKLANPRNETYGGATSGGPRKEYSRSGALVLAQSGGEEVWVDDALPAGAIPAASGGDGWNWVSSSPAPKSGSVSHISNLADWSNWSPPPYSGSVSHQSNISSGLQQHHYVSSPTPIPVRTGGTLYTHIYIDPLNVPQQVMLQWNVNGSWEHRAYWGANIIELGTNGTASRRYMGPLPAAGGWMRLNVPAWDVNLEQRNVTGVAFTLYGGRANFDLTVVEGVTYWYEQVCWWDCTIEPCWERCDYIPHELPETYYLVDDSIPAGAASGGSWNWRGANNVDLIHQHFFYNASDTLELNAGDKLFAWVYLDLASPPEELMLQWNVNGSWEHRAYWGANKLDWGGNGTTSRQYMGPLPQAGEWVKLEIPASAVGLEGKIVNGMAFSLYGGRAAWDKAGKVNPVSCVASVPTNRWKGEYFNNQTLSGSPVMVRDDSDALNLNFGGGSPSSGCGVVADNFSARWTRTVNFASAGRYRFFATVDNGVRLYVDDQLTPINHWGDLPPNTYTAEVELDAGPHVIRVEFVEYTGGASAGLSWIRLPGTTGDLSMALIDPANSVGSPGQNLLSRNSNWSLPLLGLPGRAGMDLGLSFSLNSLVYTRAGSVMHFDPDQGYPAPGFRLGFPEIRNAFTNTEAGAQSYLLSMPSGSRIEFRQINTNVYEAVDSSYMLLTHDPLNAVFILRTTDGTQFRFEDVTGVGDYKCVQIKDRQGNYITITYGSLAEIRRITDTLGRKIYFNYDTFNHLLSITQDWGGQTHTWATFAYGTQTIHTNFPGLTLNGATNDEPESVLLRVGLADGTVYSFEYNTYAQVKTIRKYAPNTLNPINFPGDYVERAYTTYGLPDNAANPQTDCPRAISRTDGAAGWHSGVKHFYEGDGHTWGQVMSPDGTIYKEFFATTGWQRGLTTGTESWSGDVMKKSTTLGWIQDNTGVSYRLNPRVIVTDVQDGVGNHRRTRMSYINFGLVSDVYEEKVSGLSIVLLRHTHTDYNLDAVYTDRRIIGLPSAVYLKDGNNTLFSKLTYQYDLGGEFLENQGLPIQHDTANYGSGFVQGRGNLNRTFRWDVYNQDIESKASKNETGYNTSGSIIFTRNPLGHQASVSYSYNDAFSDGQTRNTYAYPTKMTDADQFESFIKYNYDFGAVTWTRDPKLAVVTRTYDPIGRIDRITNEVNWAYTRYAYASNQQFVHSFTTVNDFSESQQITGFDGHGRVLVTVSEHPTSVSQLKAKFNGYDVMGRLVGQTNLIEIDSAWQPAGDDAAAGWVGTSQSYDWQGKPTVTTNQDGTTRSVSYASCGCAGGQVMTVTDEGTTVIENNQQVFKQRQKRIFFDALGREEKIESLDWNSNVYSTQINAYNVRDQIVQVNRIDGQNGANLISTRQYDGHGRLWKAREPNELGDTVYEYYPDDRLQKVTDARQAAATYTYYNRPLVRDITYTAPSGVAPTPTVFYNYDQNGNRTLMSDGLGTITYSYDQLSRLQSETRLFRAVPGPHHPDLPGTYALTYQYNLAGQVRVIGYESSAHPIDNSHWEYTYNKTGEMTAITGSPFAGVSTYATDMRYRAWGELKSLNYGNNFTLSASYNSRQQLQSLKQYRPGGLTVMDKTYQYYPDGKIKFSDDIRYQETYNNRFDRAFTYDHVGRLTNAWTGSRARGFINDLPPDETEIAPYNLKYDYDVWGNQISQSGNIWSSAINETVSYQNMRHNDWTYDAAGNVTNDGGTPFKYDAAGRNVSVDSGTRESTQTLDGDGLVGRRDPYTRRTVNDSDSHPIFYLRSTALGGKVIVEIDGRGINYGSSLRGRKLQSYVYSGETQIAVQAIYGDSSTTSHLGWKFTDPVTGTKASPSSDGSYTTGQVEPDPFGVDVGINDPAQFPPPEPLAEVPVYPIDLANGRIPGSPQNPSFTVDGMLVDQAFGQMMLQSRSGAAVLAPAKSVRTIIRDGQRRLTVWQAYADGYQGYVPVGEQHDGGGVLSGGRRQYGDTNLANINGVTSALDVEMGVELGRGDEEWGLTSTPVVAPAAAPLGFGRVVYQERIMVGIYCDTYRNGRLVDHKLVGISTDITISTIVYSPTMTAGDLDSTTMPPFGRFGWDARGHITGQALGGAPTTANLTSQSSRVNNGAYKSFENTIRAGLTDNQHWAAQTVVILDYPAPSCAKGVRKSNFRHTKALYIVDWRDRNTGNHVGSDARFFENPRSPRPKTRAVP